MLKYRDPELDELSATLSAMTKLSISSPIWMWPAMISVKCTPPVADVTCKAF